MFEQGRSQWAVTFSLSILVLQKTIFMFVAIIGIIAVVGIVLFLAIAGKKKAKGDNLGERNM